MNEDVKGVSASLVSVLMLVVVIGAASVFFVSTNRITGNMMSHGEKQLLDAKVAPKQIATVCFLTHGFVRISSKEDLIGSVYYEVKDGNNIISKGFSDVNVSDVGNIYFNADLSEYDDYSVLIKSKYWTMMETCRAQQDYGLMMYLPFSEGSGETVADTSGNNNDAWTNGSWINGTEGYALRFNGLNQYAKIDANTGFDSDKFTLAFFVLRESNSDDGEGIIDGGSFHVYSDADGSINFALDGGQTVSESLTNNEWTEFIMKYDGVNLKIYNNCTLSSTLASSYTPAMGDIFLGNSSDVFVGAIDEVYLFSRALDDKEIPAFCAPLTDVQGDAYNGTWDGGEIIII